MRKILVAVLFMHCCSLALAQPATIKGSVSDTLSKKALQNAVLSLIDKKDSTLYHFRRTDATGHFEFPEVTPGSYQLLVTYPKFADYIDDLEVKPGVNDIGRIPLTLAAKLMDAVIIRTNGSIRIKGDTTEFAADSFKVREGATVEELLRKLPGFQVNSKGEITAQGQRVQKVLVDGEEFFGDDPTIATRNIGAKAVDKVQVYDTKSENQQLTGLSTGTEGKTVNIKLKEDARKGAFGKAVFGSDYSKLIDAKAMYNKFAGNKKISAYGTKSEVSTGSLDWGDRRKLGIDNQEFEEMDGGGIMFVSGGSDEFENWNLRGLPHSYSAGGLYSNKWNNDKNNLNTSYSYNRLETSNDASTLTQNILPSQLSYRNKFQKTIGLNEQHALSGKYEWKLDSLASLKFSTSAKRQIVNGDNNTYSEFLNEQKSFVNQSNQHLTNELQRLQNDNSLVYKQLFKKKSRQLTVTLNYRLTDETQSGVVQTTTEFYRNNIVDSMDVIDQQKKVSLQSKTAGAKLTFSEPLSNKLNLVVDYSYNLNDASSYRNTYDIGLTGKYTELNRVFSNNFDMASYSHSGMTVLRFTDKKIKMAAGVGLSSIDQNVNLLDSGTKRHYSFLNFTPQSSISYTIKPQNSISVNYRGTTRQPTINQLQPLRENTDPLNIFVGNPELKVGFNHNIAINYNAFKTLKQKYIYMSLSMDLPVNQITMTNILDVTRGKQVTMPVNVNGNRNFRLWGTYQKEGGLKKWGHSIQVQGSGGRNINYVNGEQNATNYLNSNIYFDFSHQMTEESYFSFGPQFGYNINNSSLYKTFSNNYWNYGGNVWANLKFGKNYELSTNCNISLRQQLKGFNSNPNQTTWNATVGRKVMKDGKIKLVANDILNQTMGFNRNFSTNFITEERYQRVGRYLLLQFEWSFNTMPIK